MTMVYRSYISLLGLFSKNLKFMVGRMAFSDSFIARNYDNTKRVLLQASQENENGTIGSEKLSQLTF